MKKTAIVFAILLCISIVVAIVTGATAGVEAIDKVAGNAGLSQIWNGKHFNWDDSININGENYQFTFNNKSKVDEKSKEFTLKNGQALLLDAEAAAIELLPSTDGKTRAVMELFSNSTAPVTNEYTLDVVSAEQLKITLKCANRTGFQNNTTIAKLKVYLPKTQLPELTMSLDAGMFKLQELNIKTLNAKLDAGTLTIQDSQMETAVLKTSAGALNLEDNVITTKLDLSVDAGVCNLTLPADKGFQLTCDVGLGRLINTLDKSKYTRHYSTKSLTNAHKELTYLDGGYEVRINVDTGLANIKAE